MARTPVLSGSELLAVFQPWVGVADAVHELLARLADPEPSGEVLWVGCGTGRSVLWWAERFHMRVTGVDPDSRAIEVADAAAREMGLGDRVTFQAGPAEDLPHETDTFDLTIVYLPALLYVDGARVLEQAARVARPMTAVCAVVPTWLQTPTPDEERAVAQLGWAPRLLMEWKHAMRGAGLVELAVDDASREGQWLARGTLGLLVRAWGVARWRGVAAVLSPPYRILRQLAARRRLGLSIVRGVRWPHE